MASSSWGCALHRRDRMPQRCGGAAAADGAAKAAIRLQGLQPEYAALYGAEQRAAVAVLLWAGQGGARSRGTDALCQAALSGTAHSATTEGRLARCPPPSHAP